MNQVQVIKMMESVLPDIISTKDPEGVLLKCASDHNLPIAQLEKLGQVFNTYKTLAGLSTQQNRGDSFSIVDVPSMVEKYATYDPAKKLSDKSKKVHETVNKITKSASKYQESDGWRYMVKDVANTHSSESGTKEAMVQSLKSIMDSVKADIASGVVSDNSTSFHRIDNVKGHFDITFDKKASSTDLYRSVENNLRIVEEDTRQIKHEIKQAVIEKCASILNKLTPDEGRWAEAVEDIYDIYGVKSANAIHIVEDYFEYKKHSFTPADLTKRAGAQILVEDRHNVFEDIEELMKLDALADELGMGKKASMGVSDLEDVYKKNLSELQQAVADASNGITPQRDIKDLQQHVNISKRLWLDAKKEQDDQISSMRDQQDELNDIARAEKLDIKDMTDNDMSAATTALDTIKDTASNSVNALLSGMSHPLLSGSRASISSAISKPVELAKALKGYGAADAIKRQRSISQAKEQAAVDTTLQQLMLSDPVISAANPDEVQNIYNSLRSISPMLASNPTLVSSTLKEALQYGSIPLPILTEAAKFQESYSKGHGLTSNRD